MYSQETKDSIRNMYISGLNSTEISKLTGVKVGTITYWLRSWGISRHRGPKSKICNEDFFDVIDCEKKAYYLGWLMADGNISIHNGQYSLKIHISDVDKHIVDDFLKDIGSTNKTKLKNTLFKPTGKMHTSYYVSLTSVHMCKSLIGLGIVPRKTGKEFIPNIPESLKHHFVRGFFDGDGITDTKKQKRAGFVSNKQMLESILTLLGQNTKLYKHHTTPGIYYFLGGKQFSRELYKYMYKDATVFIHRKKHNLEIVCGYNDGTPYEVKVSCTV